MACWLYHLLSESPIPAELSMSPGAAGAPGNPLLACILEALGEPGAAVQAAAATALGLAGDHLRPGLDPALLSQLLRALGNPLCLGRPELCGALARLEGGNVHGLLASSCQQLLAAAPEVLGSTAGERWGLQGQCPGKPPLYQRLLTCSVPRLPVCRGRGPAWCAGLQGKGFPAASRRCPLPQGTGCGPGAPVPSELGGSRSGA